MNRNSYLHRIALGIALTVVSGTTISTFAADQTSENCSVALFGQQAPKSGRVCDIQEVRKLAEEGNVFEQNQMGVASILAVAPNSSVKEAVSWFHKAARAGYTPAQVNLGVMYANGWGVVQNDGTALYWLRTAADAGSARALFNLGMLYMKGQGVRQDYEQALRYFKRGAETCDTGAQTNLAYLYDRGLGVKADPKLAAEWYGKAAEQGDPMAQHNLGDMYLRGEGVAQSDAKALKLFEQSAAQGHTGAQIKLGYMLSEGRGATRDVQAGYRWIRTASAAGDDRGEYLLRGIEAQLSAEQKRQAEAAIQTKAERESSTESIMMLASLDTTVNRACSAK